MQFSSNTYLVLANCVQGFRVGFEAVKTENETKSFTFSLSRLLQLTWEVEM